MAFFYKFYNRFHFICSITLFSTSGVKREVDQILYLVDVEDKKNAVLPSAQLIQHADIMIGYLESKIEWIDSENEDGKSNPASEDICTGKAEEILCNDYILRFSFLFNKFIYFIFHRCY